MRISTLAIITASVGFALACGGSMPTAPIAAPWTDMNLPVGSGNVLYSDATSTTITYDSGNAGEMAKQYESAIKSWGCTEQFPLQESAGSWAYTCQKDGKNYSFAVTDAAGMVTVGLSSY